MSLRATSSWRRFGETALIAFFAVFLLLPTVDSLWGIDSTGPVNENRIPAKFPPWRRSTTPREFLAGLQRWYADHFGCRRWLIQFHNQMALDLFKDRSIGGVVIGKDGWFYWTQEGALEDYLGSSRFTEADLRAWQRLLETRRDWLAARGCKYVFVIAPNKESIYPQYLPAWFQKASSPGKLDQFMSYMRAHSTVDVLDLRSALRRAASNDVLYLKTDSHWNLEGAFVGCQELLRNLSTMLPDVRQLSLHDFSIRRLTQSAGDCASYVGGGDQVVETEGVQFMPGASLPPLQLDRNWNNHVRACPPRTWLISSCPTASARGVIFHDSFAQHWTPFLGYSFRELVWIFRYDWNAAFLAREKPTVVIDEIVERRLGSADPRKLMRLDSLRPQPSS